MTSPAQMRLAVRERPAVAAQAPSTFLSGL